MSLAQPDGCCWSANFQSAKRHPSYALHTPTAVIQCVIVSKGHSFEPVPFRNINANNLEKSRWRTTKINVSVSSVMHRTGFYTSAVSTCKSFDTHHTHEPALREECTLSRVAILAHTRLRQVVLRSGSACLNNRMSSCCDENEEQCNRSLSTNRSSLHRGKFQGWSSVAPFGNVVASVSCESCNRRRALVPN